MILQTIVPPKIAPLYIIAIRCYCSEHTPQSDLRTYSTTAEHSSGSAAARYSFCTCLSDHCPVPALNARVCSFYTLDTNALCVMQPIIIHAECKARDFRRKMSCIRPNSLKLNSIYSQTRSRKS